MKATKRAKPIKAAELIAKPLPRAAVVSPAASKKSVRPRAISGRKATSAMPTALSRWAVGNNGQAQSHGANHIQGAQSHPGHASQDVGHKDVTPKHITWTMQER